MICIKTPLEIEYIRKPNQIIAEIHERLASIIVPGVSTMEINQFAENMILAAGGRAVFKGYQPSTSMSPFPAATCISVNNEVIHGIPGSRILVDGDIVSVDIGAEVNGYYGDAATTFLVGNVDASKAALSRDTQRALMEAIRVCEVGNYLHDIGCTIERALVPKGYGIVRDYCGHGVGKRLHEDPPVLNYADTKRKGARLKAGMVLAIEPMVTLGSWKVHTASDGWTVLTKDDSVAVHWEHSVAITASGPLVLSMLGDGRL